MRETHRHRGGHGRRRPAVRYIGRNTPERIAQLRQIISFNHRVVRAFAAAGLPVLAGTDSLVAGVVASGRWLSHRELAGRLDERAGRYAREP